MNCRRRASGGRTTGASSAQTRRYIKPGKQVAGGPTNGVLLMLVAVSILVTCCSQVFRNASARYVHPTYKFRSAGLDEDMDRLERQASDIGGGGGPARRQDFDNSDGDNDDEDDDNDQNTAASYQNQDEDQGNSGRGGGGGGGGATDGYDDAEPDGPYEETPVEKEGQADLERFFDDHLGASDRDGMDKENLPSNLVSLLSEPPLAAAAVAQPGSTPSVFQQEEARATVNSITVVPMARVENQQVLPISRSAYGAAHDPLDMMSTVQETSFIRLPDEKMIVTHQVTARNRPSAPLKPLADNGAQMSHEPGDSFDEDEDRAGNVRARPRSRKTKPILFVPYGGRQRHSPAAGRSSVLEQQQRQQKPRDSLAARGSEIVATEDDDDDRVYVTNATDKPFRIADLGGYDPEEDFIDAAQELEVMATARDREHERPRPTARGPIRGRARRVGAAESHDDQYAWAASGADRWLQEPGGDTTVSFRVPETDRLYGDASETDEVTFGQDDPYQTDLEAEMRQQEYDKISGWRRQVPVPTQGQTLKTDPSDESQPDLTSGSLNVAVDSGQPASGDHGKIDDDDDNEVDNEYQSEPRVKQTEARSTRARSRPAATARQRKDDFDDEGGWANDGVEEMDIPSQAHQNTVLEKAAKREAAARRAADGPDQQPGDQSGQASDGESERMPNADYLKNDLKEDDSGYARAA